MREIPLSRGLVALVDDDDYDAVMAAGPWHATPSGGQTWYASHSISSHRKIKLHQFLTGCNGIDHANGNGLDNRRANLRPASHAQNIANTAARTRSGYKGVALLPSGRWRAAICRPRPRRGHAHLGVFETPELAARAYDAAAIEQWGEFARLNFPGGIAS